jgi:sterol desaturase/sphingolipid hydroxylase (fatty acid hydroxylase superfamily)
VPAVAERTRPRPAPLDLRSAVRAFVTFPTARWLAGMLAATVAFRVALGGWRWRDLVVAVALVGLQPFTEWLIHVYVLHWRPREILGRRVDLRIGRLHVRHHQAPKDAKYIFIPLRTIRYYAAVDAVLLALAAMFWPPVATGVAVATALTLLYEWTHWLIHTDYQPRSRLYRGVWRAHRLHHFRNENYWYGVTSHVGDRVLGTYPAKDDVPLSPTATTLGVPVA